MENMYKVRPHLEYEVKFAEKKFNSAKRKMNENFSQKAFINFIESRELLNFYKKI